MLSCLIIIWNLIIFFIYGCDKLLAKTKHRRIPEKFLLALSLIFASYGAALGMLVFNHKTSKPRFRYFVPVLTVVHTAVIYFFIDYDLAVGRAQPPLP